MVYHLSLFGGPSLLPGGYEGVDIFFVLSGFLITGILLAEWDRVGRISFRDFYIRRALRLFPALIGLIIAVMVLVGLTDHIGIVAPAEGAATIRGFPWVVVFAGNWYEAFGGNLGLLGHTWSLAIEEQFYVLWPLLLAICLRVRIRRARLGVWLAGAALAQMAYLDVLILAGYGANRLYFGTDTHSAGLLAGCAMALWLTGRSTAPLEASVSRLFKAAVWAGMAALPVILIHGAPISFVTAAAAVVVAGLVVGQAPAFLERILISRPAVLIGRCSYGLYLWHFVIYLALGSLYVRISHYNVARPLFSGAAGRVLAELAAIGLSFGAAALSYRFVELPALRRKRRFRKSSAALLAGTR